MADRVVLHIGTMKSGTTYLQDVLRGGGLEGSEAWFAASFGKQTRAVRAHADQRPGPWQALVDGTRERDGVAVFSQEFLSFAGRARVGEVLASFGGVPVDVVLTVRDQHRAVPAQWQSFTRNRGTDDWATYLRRLQRGARTRGGSKAQRSKAVRSFRRAQNVKGIVARWRGHPGLASFTAVVVPPPGSEPAELWRRFCTATAIDAAGAPQAARRSNESLGYASCEALRLVNVHLDDLDHRRYKKARSSLVDALLPLRPEEGRPGLDRAGDQLACRLNQDLLDALGREDVRLVGSVDELPTTPRADLPEVVAPPDRDEVRRALEAAWATRNRRTAPPDDLDEAVARLARRLVRRYGR